MREDYLTKEELIEWIEKDILKKETLLSPHMLKINLINASNMMNYEYNPDISNFIFLDKTCPYNDYCFSAKKENIKILKDKIYVFLSGTVFFADTSNYNFLILDNVCDTIINKLKAELTI